MFKGCSWCLRTVLDYTICAAECHQQRIGADRSGWIKFVKEVVCTKRIGHSTEPCGTPQSNVASMELMSFTEADCSLFDRYDWNPVRA